MLETTLVESPGAAYAMVLDVASVGLTDEQFARLCRNNRDLRLEMTAEGKLIIRSPAGSLTGRRNSKLNQRIANWADKDHAGISFDSSTGFILPNGAKRSPDASWIRRERWDALTEEEQEGFAPICPGFVVELRSKDDRLPPLQKKMKEYIANGARLGWLIDPKSKSVYVYQPDQPVEHLQNVATVNGDPVLRGFVLELDEIW